MRTGIYINEHEITRFFHSRSGFVIASIIAVTATLVAFYTGVIQPAPSGDGLIYATPSHWITSPLASLVASLIANLAIGYAMVVISKQFNVMRSLSRLVATMYILMQAATPMVMGQFYGGTLMSVTLILATAILFTTFASKTSVRRVFLLFFTITTGSLWCAPSILYIPILFIALAQMRIFRLRFIVAAIIGIVTPLWILLGFGLITPEQLNPPHVISIPGSISSIPFDLLPAAMLTATLGLFFFMGNLMKILSYNAQIRAYNGYIILLQFSTFVMMIVNVDGFADYLPVLNMTVAYQIAHFFAERRHRRSYLAIMATLLPYLAIYLWNIIS